MDINESMSVFQHKHSKTYEKSQTALMLPLPLVWHETIAQ